MLSYCFKLYSKSVDGCANAISESAKHKIDVTPPSSILDQLVTLENERKRLIEQKKDTEYELNRPSIKEVSFEQVHQVLKGFSTVITKVEPVKQKDLLHSIINKITVNLGNNPDERSVKDIELFFDASIKDNFVLTYDTVHRAVYNGKLRPSFAGLP